MAGAPHMFKIPHLPASLTSSPPCEVLYFMVGRYTPLTIKTGHLPTTSGNGLEGSGVLIVVFYKVPELKQSKLKLCSNKFSSAK